MGGPTLGAVLKCAALFQAFSSFFSAGREGAQVLVDSDWAVHARTGIEVVQLPVLFAATLQG